MTLSTLKTAGLLVLALTVNAGRQFPDNPSDPLFAEHRLKNGGKAMYQGTLGKVGMMLSIGGVDKAMISVAGAQSLVPRSDLTMTHDQEAAYLRSKNDHLFTKDDMNAVNVFRMRGAIDALKE